MATPQVQQAAADVHGSAPVHAAARVGMAARGLVWLVIGLLTLSVASGRSEQTDQGGALRAIDGQPLGRWLLVLATAGFLGYAGWLLLSAAVGHRDTHGTGRWLHRGESLGKGVVYLALAATVARFLVNGDSDDRTTSSTAELMSHPGGRALVGVAAAGVLGTGAYLTAKGVRGGHTECLDRVRTPQPVRRPAHWLGLVGYVGRGVVIALVGVFLARAAWQFDPSEAKGLDAALQTVATQPHGRALLVLAAVGMLAYGLWSFVEAAWRRL